MENSRVVDQFSLIHPPWVFLGGGVEVDGFYPKGHYHNQEKTLQQTVVTCQLIVLLRSC